MDNTFQTLLNLRNFLESNSESISILRSGKKRSMFFEAVLDKCLDDQKFRDSVLIYNDISDYRYNEEEGIFIDG